jgi:hypothetical protein
VYRSILTTHGPALECLPCMLALHDSGSGRAVLRQAAGRWRVIVRLVGVAALDGMCALEQLCARDGSEPEVEAAPVVGGARQGEAGEVACDKGRWLD